MPHTSNTKELPEVNRTGNMIVYMLFESKTRKESYTDLLSNYIEEEDCYKTKDETMSQIQALIDQRYDFLGNEFALIDLKIF